MPDYHRETDGIVINPADSFTLTTDTDGDPAIRIKNKVWADEPQMLLHFAGTGHDTHHQVVELAAMLHKLADEIAHQQAERDAHRAQEAIRYDVA